MARLRKKDEDRFIMANAHGVVTSLHHWISVPIICRLLLRAAWEVPALNLHCMPVQS
jgi:hypothetical protein